MAWKWVRQLVGERMHGKIAHFNCHILSKERWADTRKFLVLRCYVFNFWYYNSILRFWHFNFMCIFYFNFIREPLYYSTLFTIRKVETHTKRFKKLRCIPCTCHGIFLFDLMIFTWLFIQGSELLLAYLQKFLETKYIIA